LFSIDPKLSGGSKRTIEFAHKHRKPHLHLRAGDAKPADALRAFVEQHGVKVLNVAGPRASKEPGVVNFLAAVLDRVLGNTESLGWISSALQSRLSGHEAQAGETGGG